PAAAAPFGNTIGEAMAAGAVPAVADAGGAAALAAEPVPGHRAGTVDQFIEKTAWLAAETEARAAMAGRARAKAGEYSHARFGARVHAIIDAVAEDRPAARARFFLDDGNLPAAEGCLLDAVDEHPAGAGAHLDLADIWYRLGRREAARAMWRRGAEIDPSHPRAARAAGLADRIDLQRRHVGEVRSGALFGEDYFERGAESGLNGYTDYTDDFAPVQADIVSATFQPSTCLEIGCARGEFVREMRARGVRAFGTDISAYSVRSAAPDTRPRLTAAMISSLPYADDSFDLVTAVEVFEHVPPEEVDRAVRELWRVSRAFVWITVQNTDAAAPEHFFTDLGHVTMKPLAWWQARFRANGFEVLPFELPFGQFRLHQIIAQPLGKHARRSDAELAALGRAMLDRGEIPQLVNLLDLLDQEQRPQPALREALAARLSAA
ncbi:MAG: methyltransferase domain-containing protein, partial [Vicinamibacterales bacterium]